MFISVYILHSDMDNSYLSLYSQINQMEFCSWQVNQAPILLKLIGIDVGYC